MTHTDALAQPDQTYSEVDHDVWAFLYDRQVGLARDYACQAFLDGLDVINLPTNRAIDLAELNAHVSSVSQWRFVPAPGAMKTAMVFECLSKRQFPLNLAMRAPKERDFAELPDLFHDLFGHGPILMNTQVADLYQKFGKVATKHASDKDLRKTIERVFWFTMEVGLIRENARRKAYGAALLTSFSEINNAFEPALAVPELSISKLDAISYAFREVQKVYFEIASFEDLDALLDGLDALGQERAAMAANG